MNSPDIRSTALGFVQGLARKTAAVIGECWSAQRRMEVLRTAPDRHAARPNTAPGDYAEFLYRTSGPLLHEPPARARRRGRIPS